jgi:hypothetical protein
VSFLSHSKSIVLLSLPWCYSAISFPARLCLCYGHGVLF